MADWGCGKTYKAKDVTLGDTVTVGWTRDARTGKREAIKDTVVAEDDTFQEVWTGRGIALVRK